MKPDAEMTYAESIAQIKENQANAGNPGFNEYGCPLHACNGYRHDEHYWAWLRAVRLANEMKATA